MPYKTKQFFFFLIKLAIIVGAFYFIYDKLAHNKQLDFNSFIDQLEGKVFKSTSTIFILLGFSIANWCFEILKWYNLASTQKKLSFYDSFQQSLGSLTASLITPNRIGEYGAKAIYYKKGIRRKIMLLNLLSNMAQMSITLVLGLIGLIYFFYHFNVELEVYRFRRVAYLLVVVMVLIIGGTLKGAKKIRGFYIDKIIDFIKNLPLSTHFLNIGYSLIRYLIFSHQFYFLLKLFGIESDYISLMALISSMYLLASLVPGLALFDWLIKGSVALWVFSFIGANELYMVSIILLMWVLNFGLPSIIGSYFVLNFNFSKQK